MKVIVTTTINIPTEAIIKYCKKSKWNMIIVGDKKTPQYEYYKLTKIYPHVFYLAAEEQEKRYKKLSQYIGWNCIQRKNFGIIEAYKMGADVIAIVDDDNIPYDNWGENLLVNKIISLKQYNTELLVFDPLSVTNYNYLWHRGYPIELIQQKNQVKWDIKYKDVKILVQADLWDGDPDIDAIGRISFFPQVRFNITEPYGSNAYSPFNSQNTFLSREIIPDYFLFPHIGRMDDIWASYYVQYKYRKCVAYNTASVYQQRNPHNLIEDMDKEFIGYRNSLQFILHLPDIKKFIPERSISAFKEYQKIIRSIKNGT